MRQNGRHLTLVTQGQASLFIAMGQNQPGPVVLYVFYAIIIIAFVILFFTCRYIFSRSSGVLRRRDSIAAIASLAAIAASLGLFGTLYETFKALRMLESMASFGSLI
jgi:hypothetical protein